MAAQEHYTISAIYEDGRFRPLEPTTLPEHTKVKLTVEVAEDTFKTEDERIRAIFAAAGVPLVPRPPDDGRRPMSREEQAALAERIGPGVNASQAIIEERENGP